jgi:ribosome biogenesis GTPase A
MIDDKFIGEIMTKETEIIMKVIDAFRPLSTREPLVTEITGEKSTPRTIKCSFGITAKQANTHNIKEHIERKKEKIVNVILEEAKQSINIERVELENGDVYFYLSLNCGG